MKTGAANIKLDSIIANVEKKGLSAKGLIDDLKELREQAQEIRRDRMLDLRTKKELLEVVKLQENLIKMQLVDLYKSFEVNP